MNANHELTIQRMIDGELTQQQRSQFLSSLDEQPEVWRELALAYVENQVWSDFARQSIEEVSIAPAASNDESEILEIARLHEVNGQAQQHISKDAPIKRQSWLNTYGPRLMLTAAATLLVITIAVRWDSAGQPGVKPPAGNPEAAIKSPNRQGSDSVDKGSTSLVDTGPYMLEVDGVEPIPLYSRIDQVRESFASEAMQVNPELQKQFLDAGYQLQSNVRFISGRDSQGRSFIVPIHGWRIQSYVQ